MILTCRKQILGEEIMELELSRHIPHHRSYNVGGEHYELYAPDEEM
jgi:hypothetical protein